MFSLKNCVIGVLLALCVAFVTCRAPLDKLNTRVKRLVGGHTAQPYAAPYAVLIWQNGIPTCAGAIVSETFILTLASCAKTGIKITAGSSKVHANLRQLTVKTIHIHENYLATAIHDDIALIEITETLTFTTQINKIAFDGTAVPSNTVAQIFGWGKLDTNSGFSLHMQVLYTKTLNLQDCISQLADNNAMSLVAGHACTYVQPHQGGCGVSNDYNWHCDRILIVIFITV